VLQKGFRERGARDLPQVRDKSLTIGMCVGSQYLLDVWGTIPPKEIWGWAKAFKDLEAHVLQWGCVWYGGHKASQN